MASKGKSTNYAQMQRDVADAPKRNLTGSLDQVKQELQDAYMTFKELSARCIVDINTVNKTDKPVYYFKPDTFLLEDAEGQRFFRESLLKKIAAIPKPEPIAYLGDEMHRGFVATVADQSRPTICKKNLAMYFKRRQYALQHMKYKMLCRWAHLAMNSSQMDTGKDAVFLYGKIEYSIEQAISRCERLEQEDFFDMAIPQNRPNTKAELGEGSLYVENVDLQPQSLLREDDIEIYMRSVSYRNKVSKLVNKFMSRLKWLPMQHRFEIYEEAVAAKLKQKELNIKAQFDFIDEIEARARSMHIMTPDVEAELNEILNMHYVRQHALMYTSSSEKISNSWRSDHDNVPTFINNQHELKLRILEAAEIYDVKGDIELDHGYSFSYRVTVKFPQYFQRQCIKSQFSIYDVFAQENDKNEVQKHTLVNMTRVDTNIFRDVSTTPNMVPDDESIAYELRKEDLKVLRLKSCGYWIDYVCLVPTEADWHRKQQAILNNNNPIDTLTASGMNFLDVNDLASVNRINEDNALLHQQAVKKLYGTQNPHDMVIRKTQNSSNEGERKIAINMQDFVNSNNEEEQMSSHLLNAVQGGGVASDMGNGRTDAFRPQDRSNLTSRSGLRNTPQHLLVSFFTLRYMKSRDNKTKILYALNFCRAIQKRLALDLREFGTRERIDSHLTQPYVHSTDTDKKVRTNIDMCKNPYDGTDDKTRQSEDRKTEKMTVFDAEAIKVMKNMASVRMYKCNGTFNNKVFSTCPSVPKFHCTFGEPTMRQTEDMEMDAKKTQSGISKQSLKLMGRIDYIELNETLEEVYVKDDFGVYIMYDCTLQDMRGMEDELVKICSYYIHKSEVLQDVHTDKPLPGRDRLQVLSDLLECEATFHYKKVKLTMAYIECYEHIVDPLEQQRLMQIITDVMSRRPRLNLQANYFVDSYKAEFDCLDNQLELVKFMVKTQMDLEKVNNKMLQDSLQLSYTLCNQYEQNKFRYQDAEELLQAVINREKSNNNAKKYAQVMRSHTKRQTKDKQMIEKMDKIERVMEEDPNAEASEASSKSGKQKGSADGSVKDSDMKTKGDEAGADDSSSINSKMSDMDVILKEDQENVFQQLLGLPEISIETLYMQYKEKDKTIIKLMNEHTNFIQIHEGYPEFLNFQQGGANGAQLRNFKVCPWSEPSANLDFFDSLQFINKFYAIMTQVQQELYDCLKPYDPSVMTYIDSQVAVKALEEFRRVIKIMEGAETEYEGRQYVEDESVMGNPDKMVFHAKEMISELTMAPKTTIDPYLIAKLNVNTINFFDFPRVPKENCKYKMQYQDGVKPSDWVIVKHKQALVDAAQRKSGDKAVNIEHVIATTQLQISSTRNIDVPSQLQTYCNLVELMRLRHETILTASECSVLQQIYLKQGQHCKIAGLDVWLQDSVSFEAVDICDDQEGLVNFFEDGTSYNIKIGLAVKEYDPSLLSNFNFRNPDSFKLNITDSGLEEVRAVLMYQLLQKHLLIVATRANQMMIDSSLKAIAELDILQKYSLAVPNSTFDINSVFSRNADNLSSSMMRETRLKFGQNMSNSVANVFYSITQKKSQLRTNISKEFSNYMSQVGRVHQVKNQCVQRVMRSFKVKQLVRYCEHIILQAHLDAQKVQGIQVCQRLRTFSHYFSFDPSLFNMTVIQKNRPGEPRKEDYQIFEYETNNLIENFTYPYMPKMEEDAQLDVNAASKDIHAINPQSMSILHNSAIPSSAQLMKCESSSLEETRTFKERLTAIHKNYNVNFKEDLSKLDPTINEPERQTKEMLPSFTPRDLDPAQGKGKPEEEIDKFGNPVLDYEEALNFGQSQFAQMLRYYQYLERILSLEWFICKLQFKQDTVVHMDNAFNLGLPFWIDTDYEKRMKKEVKIKPIVKGINPISQNFLHSNIVARQTKKYIAEEISGMSLTMQNLLYQYKMTKEEQKYEYLNSYTEFRYLQILGSFHKINQQFYITKRAGLGIRSLREAISQLTKMDHVKTSYSKGNSFHVNTSLVHPQYQLLETTNLIFGAHSEDECQNFRRCVQPVINEKALEPAQLTLFQSLYQTDSFRKRMPTQFAGQLVSTHNAVSFKALDTALLDMCQEDRTYAQSFIVQAKYQANDFMEIVLDPSLSTMTQEDVYSLFQLTDAKKFLSDGTQALLLKNAIICWNENQVLPDDPKKYAKFEEHFRNNYFWKIIEHKENMVSNLSLRGDSASGIPSKQQLEILRKKIDDLQNDYSLATTTEEEHRAKMIEHLKEEFRAQKKKVTLDAFYSTKAEIMVLSNEIEKHITAASVRALDAETSALTRCLAMSQPKIQMHIHPFQQFAATLYDKVDPLKHLDMSEKLNAVQEFLTKLVNRGTEVETLTSGPGVVFTKKDFNEAIQAFCRRIITYGEQELKNRSDSFFQKEEHYMHLIYVKDQRITDMEKRIKNTAKNIENTISSKLFEKGNQLIYQLDSTSRLLTLFKQNMFNLETEVKTKILGEQAQKFKLQKDALDTQIEKLNDYKNHVSQIVSEKFASDYDKIMVDLKKKVEQVWNIDPEMTQYVPPTLYPATGNSQYRNPVQAIVIGGSSGGAAAAGPGAGGVVGNPSSGKVISNLALEQVATLPGSVIPEGFTHYSHCSCFQPSKQYPNYSLEHAELEMYTEQQARFELARVCEVMRKQRLFWRTKEMLMKQKYQNKINLMKKQLSNNAYLWDQMAESKKRETILKQELLFTQQSLSSAEKVIEKLQEEMKKVEADRQRLYKYKHSKAERLKELEDKIKKFEVYENIDTDKLINVLSKKDEECKKLQGIADNFTDQISLAEHRKEREVGHFKGKLVQEQVKTQQIVEKMEQMKLELKMLESNDTSVAAIWKKKCLDLFEVCQTLKNENEELRDRCKELIVQGIQLADAVNQETHEQNLVMQQNHNLSPSTLNGTGYSLFPVQKPLGPNNLSLPKLQSAGSAHRTQTQQYVGGKPTPGTAGVTSGRQGSSTAGTFDYASVNGGVYDPASRLVGGGVQSVQGDAMMASNFSNNDQAKSLDRHFASTMNATAKHGSFQVGKGGIKNMLRSPQIQQTNVPFAKRKEASGPRRQGAPQTHQTKRGRTGPAGPVYYMPGTTTQDTAAQHVLRPGQFTRQKPRHQLKSLMSNDKDNMAESSFNQSFHVQDTSTDKFNRSQINSNQAQRNLETAYGTNPLIANSAQRAPNSGLNFHGVAQAHNDSLFESSKASTNNQVRRTFNKNNPVRPFHAAVRANEQMMGAAVFGAKITQQSTAMKVQSTKMSSNVTEINSKVKDATAKKEESVLGEQSFAPNKPVGESSLNNEQK